MARPEQTDPRDYATLRRQMIDRQLKSRGIHDERVLQAMAEVPREEFVLPELRDHAYEDRPLPIGHHQTISQPYTVAFLVEALELTGREKVLEIGAGSGYQSAVMSRLASVVFAIERIPELTRDCKERLQRLGYDNVHVTLGNGTLGLPEEAPFDAIVAAASAEDVPQPLLEQLAEGGRLVIPLGARPAAQQLYRYTLRDGRLHAETLGGFAFVPMIGEYGWKEGMRDEG